MSNNIIKRSPDEQKQAEEIYSSFRNELLQRQLSNTENYDKAILALSSASLAISVTFIKSIVPIKIAQYLWLLTTSWVCFLLSIISSLIAYLVSNAAINMQLEIAEDYYVNEIASAFTKENRLSQINNYLNYFVGLSFVSAMTTLMAFVIVNLNSENTDMSNKENTRLTPSVEFNDSASVTSMRKVPSDVGISINSAQIPKMQAAPGANSQRTESNQPSSTSDKEK